MLRNTPYTYLIGWSQTSMFYYGVRYAKDCDPSELFIRYFTSSKHVKHYINKYGEPDIIQVRKTFNDIQTAIKWESKVLNRLNVKERKDFLNHTHNEAIIPKKFDRAKNFEKWLQLPYEERYSEDTRARIAEKTSKRMKQIHAEGCINYDKPEDTTNYKKAAMKRWSDPDFRRKARYRKHMNNGVEARMVLPEDQQQLLKSGWKFGRL